MNDAEKEMCNSIRLAVVKEIIEMKNEEIWALVTKSIEKVGKDNEDRQISERKADD